MTYYIPAIREKKNKSTKPGFFMKIIQDTSKLSVFTGNIPGIREPWIPR
jgi:hypothetical protein